MTTSESLFDRAAADIEYSDIEEFLQEHNCENERVEYKSDMTNRIVDTLVSMSNGSRTGLIVVGVSEKRGQNIPDKWPLLDPSKNYQQMVYNYSASSVTPLVTPEVIKRDAPVASRAVVLIRVRSGPHKPYASRDRGVLIRVGDQDRPADPATLEALFRRRQEPESQRERFSTLLARCKGEASGEPPHYFLVAVPAALSLQIVLSEVFDDSVGSILNRHLPALWGGRFRQSDSLGFSSGEQQLELYADGALYFRDAAENTPGSSGSISLMRIGRHLIYALRFIREFYPNVFAYSDTLLFGVTCGPLTGRQIDWPHARDAWYSAPSQIRDVTTQVWQDPSLRLLADFSPVAEARKVFKLLAWQMQYEGYEGYVDQMGKALEDSPS